MGMKGNHTGPGQRIQDLPSPGKYAKYWKQLVAADKTKPDAKVEGEWPPRTVGEVRADFLRALDRRITRRGPAAIESQSNRDVIDRRIRDRVRGTDSTGCKWCGRRLREYRPEHDRFCDADCRRLYRA